MDAGVDLLAQHIGDLACPIGTRLTDRQWYGHVATLTPDPAGPLPGTSRADRPSVDYATPSFPVTSR